MANDSIVAMAASDTPGDKATEHAPGAWRSLSEPRKAAIFLVMSVGMFMAVLDIQIVAASSAAIQAGLAASAEEIDWLQTAYLMAEIVMIPLSAFLAEAISTRWLFVLSAGLFTLVSLTCGLTSDLTSMTILRALQGFVGGAMIPVVFATAFAFFQGQKLAMATAVLGVISTLAPALGPTIGGWIADTASWRWLFFINIAPGIAVTAALFFLGPVDEAQPWRLAHIDWLHGVALAVFLGGLQYVLQEGPTHGWFDDRTIATVAWFAFIGAAVFFERCLYSANPIVNLEPFRRRGFGPACLVSAVIGFGLYTSVYLTPVFLARVRGFNGLDIGQTVGVTGLFMALRRAARRPCLPSIGSETGAGDGHGPLRRFSVDDDPYRPPLGFLAAVRQPGRAGRRAPVLPGASGRHGAGRSEGHRAA